MELSDEKQTKRSEAAKAMGRKLKSLRLLVGMSQEELAEKIDVKPATIDSIEHGKYNTGIRQITDIVDALGYEMVFIKKCDLPTE